jgi:leader peptidase (prepilin peptidase) / N-methyltransferase
MALAVIAAAVGGLLIGSFLNVVAHRLGRRESIVSPASHCPGCGTPIRARDNVPVVSWLLLRGRCRACGEPISPRYPLVELTTAALFAAVVLARDADVEIALGLLLVVVAIPAALIDLEHRIIPNRLLLPAAVAALAIGVALDADGEVERLIAGASAGGFFFIAAMAYPRGMGMGDVKYAATLGLMLGRSVAPAVLVALVSGVAVGAVIIARKGAAEGRKTAVPFGPFLSLGGIVGALAGPELVDAYLDHFT